MLLAPHADLVVSLFAEFSQHLLGDFLRASKDYTLEFASVSVWNAKDELDL